MIDDETMINARKIQDDPWKFGTHVAQTVSELLDEIDSLQGHLRRVERSNEKLGHESEVQRQQRISGE